MRLFLCAAVAALPLVAASQEPDACKTALAREDNEVWAYPRHVFDLYKSAEVHTVKRTFQSRNKRALIMLGIAAAMMAFVYFRIHGSLTDEQQQRRRSKSRKRRREPPMRLSTATPTTRTCSP